ncbi:MAG: DUF2142 domain-containing protein [Lachnospiraceae bacterium]|nr:DUF2142 domain-containing protein [Lachnospiraceae bacterium]
MYFSLGIMYLCIDPISSTPDEQEHMLRAYGISRGDFIAEINSSGEGGGFAPENMVYGLKRGATSLKDMYDNIGMEASDNEVFMIYSNTALYSPITYFPQSLGIFLARLFCNKPYIWAYTGRVFNMITIGLLAFWTIKIIPIGKYIVFIFLMLPMNMYECASLSGGGLAFTGTLLLTAYVLWLRYEKKGKINKCETAIIYILLLIVASCKIVYAPFVLLVIMIPRELFGSKKIYIFHIVCASVMIFTASAGWVSIASRYLIEYNEGVDSIAQCKFMLRNPLNYIQVVFNTFMYSGEWVVRTFFAGSLGYFDVNVNIFVILMSAFNIVYVVLHENLALSDVLLKKYSFKIPSILIFCSVIITIFGILSSEYVQWTPYGYNHIEGLQGRYFFPVVVPALLAVKKKQITNNKTSVRCYCGNDAYNLIIVGFVNLLTIITLFVHYI